MSTAYALTLAVALLCLAHSAMSHGGGLHDWTWSSPDHNFTRVQLAVASKFAFYNASQAGYAPGILPYWDTKAPAATATGTIQIWEYLDLSCRETAALTVKLQFTSGKKPIANSKMFVWGMTGNCSAGVEGVYVHNATLGATRFNVMWVGNEAVTNSSGLVAGTAPNILFPRQVANANGPALKSVLVALHPNASPLLCADLVWQPYNAAAWAQKVAACKRT